MIFRLLLLVLSLGICTCSATDHTSTIVADAVYLGGKIWTGHEHGNFEEAIAVANGKIIDVGSNVQMERYAATSKIVVNLNGKLVVPGFIDSHTHFIPSGFRLGEIKLRDVKTRDEFVQKIAAKANSLPKGSWILGGSWDHEAWGGELPSREWIDAVTPYNPVFIMRHAGHMTFSNSLALRLAGVNANTPDPAGGEIVRNTSGEPTGVMKEAAKDIVEAVIPAPSAAQQDAAFDRAQALALSLGVTQIHDVYDWPSFQTFLRARDRAGLQMRIYSLTRLEEWQKMADYVAQNGNGNDWLRWGGVKGYVDGALGASTAWFYEPYTDAPTTSGMARYDLAELRAWIKCADAAGLQIAMHAIGDRANDWVLDTFEQIAEENGPRDRRFRIEHAQHLSKGAFARFSELGVIASMQPFHAIDDGRWAQKRIGSDRIKRTYAFRSLLDAGAVIAFGSDWFVAPLDPATGIDAAVNRETLDGVHPNGWVPKERISIMQAMSAYTVAAAYAGFQENKLGTLEAGKLADFVILSQDVFSIPSDQIKDTKVLRTIIGGKERYVRPDNHDR